MSNLILHVGPGKCGSSSIQHFFSHQESSFLQNVRYLSLDPSVIKGLNEPKQPLRCALFDQLEKVSNQNDSLILSHEFLFQAPISISRICEFAKNRFNKITVIGYSRPQSGFLAAAYSQWLFRSVSRVNEVNEIVSSLELNCNLFTGLERQFIASITNDFYSARQLSEYSILNWNESYSNIYVLTKATGVEIKCGTLPKSQSGISLVQDFCNKADLTLLKNSNKKTVQVINPSFHPDMVEMINNALMKGRAMPSPHEDNNILVDLSSQSKSVSFFRPEFLEMLSCYVDGYYWSSNLELCKKYNLDPSYFKPALHVDKVEILDFIRAEGHYRASNRVLFVEYYRELSSNLTAITLDAVSRRFVRA